jgi:hypothetical protein
VNLTERIEMGIAPGHGTDLRGVAYTAHLVDMCVLLLGKHVVEVHVKAEQP